MKKTQIMQSIHSLPLLSSTVLELLALFSDDDFSYQDIERVINHDPSLAVKILRIANSPLFGLQAKIATIREACIVLGAGVIHDMALCAELSDKFPQQMDSINVDQLWFHSLGTGIAAKLLAKELKINASYLFVVGLLHEIGHLYLAYYQAPIYEQMLEFSQRKHCGIYTSAMQVMGFPIAHISAELIHYWRLPEQIGNVIECHQDSEIQDQHGLILQLANALSCMLEIGDSCELPLQAIDANSLQVISIPLPRLKRLLPKIEELSYSSKTILKA